MDSAFKSNVKAILFDKKLSLVASVVAAVVLPIIGFLFSGPFKYMAMLEIFVCKYRKRLLEGTMQGTIKEIFSVIELRSDFSIDIMETDKDHIHLLVSYPPDISVTSIVRRLKQNSTRAMWNRYPQWLQYHFWRERTFWSNGYFVCSIGEASPETVRKYIESQG